MNRIKQVLHKGRYFDEERAFYDMTIRNHLLQVQDKPKVNKPGGGINTEANQERRRNKMMIQQLKGLCRQALDGVISEDEIKYILSKLSSKDYQEAVNCLEEIKEREEIIDLEGKLEIEEIITKIKDYFFEKQIY